MRKLLLLSLAAAASIFAALRADERKAPNRYRERRDRLAKMVLEKEKGAPALILLRQGRSWREEFNPYRPDANFFYLTGNESEGGGLLLLAKAGEPARNEKRDHLFFPKCDRGGMQWTGFFLCAGEPDGKADDPAQRALDESGAEAIHEESTLAETVIRMAKRQEIQTLYVAGEGTAPGEALGPNEALVNDLRARLPGLAIKNALPLLTEMRLVKDEDELAKIRRACAITTAAHQRVARTVKPGMYEYELQGWLELEYKLKGATGFAFPSIVGAGPNSVTLHYESNRSKMLDGQLVVVDIGSEYEHYASDLTRTYPVNGHFSARQRQIYTWVYEAQAAAFKAAKPGSTLVEMDRVAHDYLKGKSCGPKPEDNCNKYFIHGVGHTVGLETHDAGHAQTLQPGFVITNEPGIYIEHDALNGGAPVGVRIEDTLVITKDGYETLSPAYHSADEVEAAMRAK